MSKVKTHVKKGDLVEVITGAHKGATGRILQILPKKNQVLIEGVRLIKRHLRKTADSPSGSISEREGPLHISNVKLVEKADAEEKKSKKKAA